MDPKPHTTHYSSFHCLFRSPAINPNITLRCELFVLIVKVQSDPSHTKLHTQGLFPVPTGVLLLGPRDIWGVSQN